jgi:hypothetical protein
VSADQALTEEGARKAFGGEEYRDSLALVQAFLHFPLEVKPAAPDSILPHVWEAKTRGFYCFRDGWNGAESIVAQLYAKAGKSCGWGQAEAGCFQMFGFGHAWATKENDNGGKQSSRWYDNVVMLPEDPIDAWNRGRVTYSKTDPKTGSGAVTIDMDNVYQCLRQVGDDKERFDGGIHGLRSFAADYSGKSGAPALFAVVDRVTGGRKKIWMWQLPREGRDGPACKVDIQGNSFSITYSNASLKATVVSPKNARIVHARGPMKANPLSGMEDGDVNAIHVTGADPTFGEFLVVVTLQKNGAPDVSVEGEGLTSKVMVGGQTVRFDGQKIVMGE